MTPYYLQYGMVCMALSHRINRTRCDMRYRALSEKFYWYWGIAVRCLNEHLGMEDGRSGDIVIAGILTLLLTDVSRYPHGTRGESEPPTLNMSQHRSNRATHSTGDATSRGFID